MTKLQQELIQKISSIKDENILQAIKNYLKFAENDEVYQLSEAQVFSVNEAEEDIKNGKILSNEEADRKIDEWLKGK